MRVKTLQIVWHEKEPVCSLDFSKSGVLATGGADKTIKVLLLGSRGAVFHSLSRIAVLTCPRPAMS